jgi:hypothetical protein
MFTHQCRAYRAADNPAKQEIGTLVERTNRQVILLQHLPDGGTPLKRSATASGSRRCGMADMRRHSRELPAGSPQIQFRPDWRTRHCASSCRCCPGGHRRRRHRRARPGHPATCDDRPVEGAQRSDSLLLVGHRTGDHYHTVGDQAIAGGNATLAAAIVDQAASHQTTSLYRRRLHRLCPGLLDDG